MTTEEHAPVRCEGILIGRVYGGEYCVLPAGHSGNHRWRANPMQSPAPEETVETTEERCPQHQTEVLDVNGDCEMCAVLYEEALDEAEAESHPVNAARLGYAEPPAPEPAGEAEGHAHDWLLGDFSCSICGAEHPMFPHDEPAPSSGTPGLTEAYEAWRALSDFNREMPIALSQAAFRGGYIAGAAEARAPLEARIAELEATLATLTHRQFSATDRIADAATKTAVATVMDSTSSYKARAENAERQLVTLLDKYPWLATELTPPASTAAEDSKRLEEARLNESGFSFDESPVRE